MKVVVLLILTLSVVCQSQLTTKLQTDGIAADCSSKTVTQEEIHYLKEQLKYFETKQEEVDAKMKKMTEDKDSQDQIIHALESKIQAQDNKIQEQESVIQNQEDKLQPIIDRLTATEHQLNQTAAEKIAQSETTFYAKSLKDINGNGVYRQGDKLVYETPLLNPGNHYNSSTEIYTCPVSGLCLFVYSVYAWNIKLGSSNAVGGASLYREGFIVTEIYHSNHNSMNNFITLSHADLVSCQAGQRVWLQSRFNNNLISGSTRRNTFGGVLIYTT